MDKKQLEFDASGTTSPTPEKLAVFLQRQNRSNIHESSGTGVSMSKGKYIFSRKGFYQTLSKADPPPSEEDKDQ